MHELSMIKSVIDTVTAYAKKHKIKKIKRVYLKTGKMNGFVPDAMKFVFSASIKDTFLEGAKLLVKTLPARVQCSECGKKTILRDIIFECGKCGSGSVNLIGGRELEIYSIEY